MTDRTDHRAEAERMLADADEWAALAGELSPKASERACLDRAQAHALLAIHDTLTAADRYAANEAKQREAAREATGGDLSAPKSESEDMEGPDTDNAQNAILCPECDDHINTHNMEGCRRHRCDCPRTPEDVARALIADAAKPTWCPKCGHHIDDHHDGGCVTFCDCMWKAATDG